MLLLRIVGNMVCFMYNDNDYDNNNKFHPITGHKGPEGEQRYSSTPSLTSGLDGVGCQHHAPAVLHPGKTRCPLYRRLGGPQRRLGRVRKISPPHGFDPRTVQPVASRNNNNNNNNNNNTPYCRHKYEPLLG